MEKNTTEEETDGQIDDLVTGVTEERYPSENIPSYSSINYIILQTHNYP